MRPQTSAGHRGILRQLFKLNLITTVSIGVIVGILVWYGASAFMFNKDVSELRSRIMLIAELGLPGLLDGTLDADKARAVLESLNHHGQYHIALSLNDGTLLGDIEEDETPDAFRSRFEVSSALRNGEGTSRRYSNTNGKTMLYLARRLPENGPARAVVRVAIPMANLDGFSKSDLAVLSLFVIAFILFTLVISYGTAAKVINPVEELEEALEALGAGMPVKRLAMPEVPHMNVLANALNSAADRLDEKIASLENERAFSSMILANMPSGIVTLNDSLTVTAYNDAAAEMLGLEKPMTQAHLESATIENLELIRILYDTVKTLKPVSGEIKLGAARKIVLAVLATPMTDSLGIHTGILLMLSDLTLVRRLETVRQDFVGNVAHELRTPVTSICGFAELLSRSTSADSEKISKYSTIVLRQARQMEMIINDLLTLASLDNNDSSLAEAKEVSSLVSLISSAVELCHEQIANKGADIVVNCEKNLTAFVHPGLLEQALVNLIGNAIKYGITDHSKLIEISATQNDDIVEIQIIDHGAGIPEEHLARIFERFYRVDKGRSREQGGTGLGLAIVKHIMQLHDGSVSVDSERGVRTCFTLRFPVRPQDE